MNLASVANEDRPYVVLYLNALFTLPLSFPDGTRLTHEEVINLLDKETVNYDANFGVSGPAGELLSVSIKIEVSKYATGISLLRDLIYHSEFAEDRLGVTIAKLQQSLPQYKRDGNGVAGAVSTDLTFDESCTARCATVTGMMEWVPRISKELKESPKEVVRKMKKIQAISTFFLVFLTCLSMVLILVIVTDPSSFRFSVTGNVLDTSKPKADWENFRPRSASGSTPVCPYFLLGLAYTERPT
jgi:Zn-dependent M16 (insulinase) family peptidase